MDTNGWPVLDSSTEYGNPYFDVERLDVELPSGRANDYYRIRPRSEAAIGVATHEGDLVLVELYRPRLGGRFVEFPGGAMEEGETPEAAASREFTEETGYEPQSAERIGSFYSSAWNPAEQHVVWLGEVASPEKEPTGREPEVRSVITVPPSAALDRIVSEPTPSWSVTPLVLARREGYLPQRGDDG